MRVLVLLAAGVAAYPLAAQPDDKAAPEATAPAVFVVERGTRVPLSLINSISTKHAAPGDRVYLESAFPILVNGRVVIPPGSYVAGTVTDVKRPGRIKAASFMLTMLLIFLFMEPLVILIINNLQAVGF